MREDVLHYEFRGFLLGKGWRLVAGQYPDGTDDLPPLNVVDPELARDHSPDHRRHSKGKLVPDLVACCGELVLIAEIKAAYDAADEVKLDALVGTRRTDFLTALMALEAARPGTLCVPAEQTKLARCIGLPLDAPFPRRSEYGYLLGSESEVRFIPGSDVPDLEVCSADGAD